MISNPIISIAKKEFMDNIRNKWIIVITIIFASLTLLASYAGSLYSEGWQDLSLTILAMNTLVQFLIPIIGLMLGYASVVGEIERGSMNSLVSLPTNRLEILIGKFLGLGAVLSTTIFIGFGIAGIIISINASGVNYINYLIFIGASILIGLVFLSISILVSSYFKRRSTSMGMAIFIWFFFNMIWSFIISAIGIAVVGLEKFSSGAMPDWMYALSLVNPLSAYSGLVSLAVLDLESIADSGIIYFPSFYTNGLMLIILLIWIFVPLIIGYLKIEIFKLP